MATFTVPIPKIGGFAVEDPTAVGPAPDQPPDPGAFTIPIPTTEGYAIAEGEPGGIPSAPDFTLDGVRERLAESLDIGADLFQSLGKGVGNLGGLAATGYGLVTGDFDNWLAEKSAWMQTYFESQKSPTLKGEQDGMHLAAEEGRKRGGEWGAALATIDYITDHPRLMSSFLAEQAPNLVPGLGAARGAALGAQALGAGAAMAGRIGTAAAIVAGASLDSADAAQQAIQQLRDLPKAAWLGNPRVVNRMETYGEDFETAREAVLTDLARDASKLGGTISLLSNLLPGARYLERAMTGVKMPADRLRSLIGGVLGEGVSEGIAEAVGAFSANWATKQIDLGQDLFAGTGEQGALGALMGGVFGSAAVFGSQSDETGAPGGGSPGGDNTGPTIDDIMGADTVDDALRAAARGQTIDGEVLWSRIDDVLPDPLGLPAPSPQLTGPDGAPPAGPGDGPTGGNPILELMQRARLQQFQDEAIAQTQTAPGSTTHQYASTQFPLNEEQAAIIKQAGLQHIDPADLAPKGLEDRPHITVLYGLEQGDAADVSDLVERARPILAKHPEIVATVGPLEVFETPDGDVLVQRLESEELNQLREELRAALPNEQTFDEYKPHITIGYLKRGTGEKYLGIRTGLENQVLVFDALEFADKTEGVRPVPLGAAATRTGGLVDSLRPATDEGATSTPVPSTSAPVLSSGASAESISEPSNEGGKIDLAEPTEADRGALFDADGHPRPPPHPAFRAFREKFGADYRATREYQMAAHRGEPITLAEAQARSAAAAAETAQAEPPTLTDRVQPADSAVPSTSAPVLSSGASDETASPPAPGPIPAATVPAGEDDKRELTSEENAADEQRRRADWLRAAGGQPITGRYTNQETGDTWDVDAKGTLRLVNPDGTLGATELSLRPEDVDMTALGILRGIRGPATEAEGLTRMALSDNELQLLGDEFDRLRNPTPENAAEPEGIPPGVPAPVGGSPEQQGADAGNDGRTDGPAPAETENAGGLTPGRTQLAFESIATTDGKDGVSISLDQVAGDPAQYTATLTIATTSEDLKAVVPSATVTVGPFPTILAAHQAAIDALQARVPMRGKGMTPRLRRLRRFDPIGMNGAYALVVQNETTRALQDLPPPPLDGALADTAVRMQNARDTFVASVVEQFGLPIEAARAALNHLLKVRVARMDPNIGRVQLSHGRFWDADVMRLAAKMGGYADDAAPAPEPAPEPPPAPATEQVTSGAERPGRRRRRVSDAVREALSKEKFGKANTVFTKEEADSADARLRELGRRFTAGFDPEITSLLVKKVGYYVEAGVRALADVINVLVEDFGGWIAPYIPSAYAAVKLDPRVNDLASEMDDMDTITSTAQALKDGTYWDDLENPDDAGTPGDLAGDSGAGTNADDMGQGPVPAGTGRPGGNTGAARPGGGRGGSGSAGGAGVPAGGALDGRTGGNSELPAYPGNRPAAGGAAGSPVTAGGGAAGGTGVSTGPRPTGAPGGRTDTVGAGESASARQSRIDASDFTIQRGDRDNIAATVPALLPGQVDDVARTETFWSSQGDFPGILVTNGTGTGKTFTGLGIAKRLLMAGDTDSVLIVTTTQPMVSTFVREAKSYFNLEAAPLSGIRDAGTAQVAVTTYANFYQNRYLFDRRFGLLIYDESHYLMREKNGAITRAVDQHWALSLHPDHVEATALAREPLRSEVEAIEARHPLAPLQSRTALTPAARKKLVARLRAEGRDLSREAIAEDAAALGREMEPLRERARQDYVPQILAERRPNVVYLSATPFAYVKAIQYVDQSIIAFGTPGRPTGDGDGARYNSGNAFERYLMSHFGFRMRYNKLTRPESGVDAALMERMWNENLLQSGALIRRMLDVDADYSRQFYQYDNALGKAIDEGMSYVRGYRVVDGKYQSVDVAMSDVAREFFRQKWDYLYLMTLIEGLNAKEAVRRAQMHLALGRKVVAFHRYKTRVPSHPFRYEHAVDQDILTRAARRFERSGEDGHVYRLMQMVREELENLETTHPHLYNLPLDDLANPITLFQETFGDRLRLVNGDVKGPQRQLAVEEFQRDGGSVDVILAQMAAGREGISLHDVTGRHQRALIHVGLPVEPIDLIQAEGRIYRVGVKTNAIYEMLRTGLGYERVAFAQTVAQRSGTAENLAMGNDARDLQTAIVDAYLDPAEGVDPNPDQGTGQKAVDRARSELSRFDQARTLYWANQKRTSRTKSDLGQDYFPTPEPLGLKMVEWAGIQPRERAMEPSAGHGAIARWFPTHSKNTFVEMSPDLAPTLQMRATQGNVRNMDFLELHAPANKVHAIVMNPPFGMGGAQAIRHLQKATEHLYPGGRIVAIVPADPSMDKRLEKWLYEDDPSGVDMHKRADILLPSVTFGRAGTTEMTRLLVLDYLPEAAFGEGQANTSTVTRDLTGIDDINALFDRIEDMEAPERNQPGNQEGLWDPEQDDTGGDPDAGNSFGGLAPEEEDTADEDAPAPSPAPDRPAPAASGAHPASDRYSISDQTNTQNGETMYMVHPLRFLGDEFQTVSARVKAAGGYYSRYRNKALGIRAGFAFPSAEARTQFLQQEASPGVQFALQVAPIGFYSNLGRAASGLKQAVGTPEQMLAAIKKTPGVKQEEIDFTGLEEFLATFEGGRVTRSEIEEYLSANGVQVEVWETREEDDFLAQTGAEVREGFVRQDETASDTRTDSERVDEMIYRASEYSDKGPLFADDAAWWIWPYKVQDPEGYETDLRPRVMALETIEGTADIRRVRDAIYPVLKTAIEAVAPDDSEQPDREGALEELEDEIIGDLRALQEERLPNGDPLYAVRAVQLAIPAPQPTGPLSRAGDAWLFRSDTDSGAVFPSPLFTAFQIAKRTPDGSLLSDDGWTTFLMAPIAPLGWSATGAYGNAQDTIQAILRQAETDIRAGVIPTIAEMARPGGRVVAYQRISKLFDFFDELRTDALVTDGYNNGHSTALLLARNMEAFLSAIDTLAVFTPQETTPVEEDPLTQSARAGAWETGPGTTPEYRQWRQFPLTLPRGKDATLNYREFLFRLPTGPGQAPGVGRYESAHFTAIMRNSGLSPRHQLLAHARTTIRTASDGGRYLYIEELQSDWQQDARSQGMQSPKGAMLDNLRDTINGPAERIGKIFDEYSAGARIASRDRAPLDEEDAFAQALILDVVDLARAASPSLVAAERDLERLDIAGDVAAALSSRLFLREGMDPSATIRARALINAARRLILSSLQRVSPGQRVDYRVSDEWDAANFSATGAQFVSRAFEQLPRFATGAALRTQASAQLSRMETEADAEYRQQSDRTMALSRARLSSLAESGRAIDDALAGDEASTALLLGATEAVTRALGEPSIKKWRMAPVQRLLRALEATATSTATGDILGQSLGDAMLARDEMAVMWLVKALTGARTVQEWDQHKEPALMAERFNAWLAETPAVREWMDAMTDSVGRSMDAHQRLRQLRFQNEEAIGAAPFGGNGWAELATKKLLQQAAREGLDGVAWTPGFVHAARWSGPRQATHFTTKRGKVYGGTGDLVAVELLIMRTPENRPWFAQDVKPRGTDTIDAVVDVRNGRIDRVHESNNWLMKVLLGTDEPAGAAVFYADRVFGAENWAAIRDVAARLPADGGSLPVEFVRPVMIGAHPFGVAYDQILRNTIQKVARKLDKGAAAQEVAFPLRGEDAENYEREPAPDDPRAQVPFDARQIRSQAIPITEGMRRKLMGDSLSLFSHRALMRRGPVRVADRAAVAQPDGWRYLAHATPVPTNQVVDLVTAVEAGLDEAVAGTVRINVIRAADIPAEVALLQPPGRLARAWVIGDEITLVADRFASVRDAAVHLAHELVGHLGVNRIMDAASWREALQTFDRMKRIRSRSFERLHSELRARYGQRKGANGRPESTLSSIRELQEFLAIMQEKRETEGVFARLWRLVRTAIAKGLRRLGFKRPFAASDLDIILDRSAEYLRTGKGAAVGAPDEAGDGDLSFSLEDEFNQGAELDAVRRVFAPPAMPWVRRARFWYQKYQGHHRTYLIQKMVNPYVSMRRVLNDDRAWMMSDLSHSATSAMEAGIEMGRLFYGGDVIQVDNSLPSLMEILEPLGGDVRRFMYWIVGNRAQRLAGEGRENWIQPHEVQTFMAMNQEQAPGTVGYRAGRPQLFETTRRAFEAWYDAVVRIGVETGLIDEDEADLWETQGFYLPFYRVLDDEMFVRGPRVMGNSGLVMQRAYQRLKGGRYAIEDPFVNMMMNVHHLLSASLKNAAARAALQTATVTIGRNGLPIATRIRRPYGRPPDDAVYVRMDGQEVWYQLNRHDGEGALVLDSLVAINRTPNNGLFEETASMAKRVYTFGTTFGPGFKSRNAVRDTLQAIATAGMDWRFWRNISMGWGATRPGTAVYAEMMAAGAMFPQSGYMHGADADDARRLIERRNPNGGPAGLVARRNTRLGIVAEYLRTAWDGIVWAYRHYQDLGTRLENMNRAANYVQARAAGRSRLQAAHEARDHTDFTRVGSSELMRWLAATSPFLNARTQGSYKAARAATDPAQRRRFWTVTGILSGVAILAYLAIRDDDEYNALEQWQRDTYIWFRLPGVGLVKIARPFEVGSLTVLAERLTEQFMFAVEEGGVRTELFAERIYHLLADTLAFNPVPQLLRPPAEILADKVWFTGRRIEGESLEELLPTEGYRASTSRAARLASDGVDAVIGGIPVVRELRPSPVQIEALVRGYFGWLGAFLQSAADGMVDRWNEANGAPPRLPRKWQEIEPASAFFQSTPLRNTRHVNEFYDVLADVRAAYASANHAEKMRDDARLAAIEEDHDASLKVRRMVEKTAKTLSDIRADIDVATTGVMTEREKRQHPGIEGRQAWLEALLREQNDVARDTMEFLREDSPEVFDK